MGPGDMVRPTPDIDQALPVRDGLQVMARAMFAAITLDVLEAAKVWPELIAALLDLLLKQVEGADKPHREPGLPRHERLLFSVRRGY